MSFTLPAYLGTGLLSMYGIGSNVSGQWGVVAPPGYAFNYVYAIWDGGGNGINVGDSILYNQRDVVCRLAYDNGTYDLLETNKVILIEEIILPP